MHAFHVYIYLFSGLLAKKKIKYNFGILSEFPIWYLSRAQLKRKCVSPSTSERRCTVQPWIKFFSVKSNFLYSKGINVYLWTPYVQHFTVGFAFSSMKNINGQKFSIIFWTFNAFPLKTKISIKYMSAFSCCHTIEDSATVFHGISESPSSLSSFEICFSWISFSPFVDLFPQSLGKRK